MFGLEEVWSVEAFLGALRDVGPGDEVKVELHRGDDRRTVTVTLGEWAGGRPPDRSPRRRRPHAPTSRLTG